MQGGEDVPPAKNLLVGAKSEVLPRVAVAGMGGGMMGGTGQAALSSALSVAMSSVISSSSGRMSSYAGKNAEQKMAGGHGFL